MFYYNNKNNICLPTSHWTTQSESASGTPDGCYFYLQISKVRVVNEKKWAFVLSRPTALCDCNWSYSSASPFHDADSMMFSIKNDTHTMSTLECQRLPDDKHILPPFLSNSPQAVLSAPRDRRPRKGHQQALRLTWTTSAHMDLRSRFG